MVSSFSSSTSSGERERERQTAGLCLVRKQGDEKISDRKERRFHLSSSLLPPSLSKKGRKVILPRVI